MSLSRALRRSPKPGAFTAATWSTPRSLLTTSVASASPSTSSAITSSGLPCLATFSSSGTSDLIELIFFSWTRMYGLSRTTDMLSTLLTKCGLRYPLSNCMPSTSSTVVSSDWPSSTVITPSLPTFSIASASFLPISASWLAEQVATCSICLVDSTGMAILPSSSTMVSTAVSIPRLTCIGLAPAVMFLRPSSKMLSARIVAVVVPSPATLEVFEATSLTIWAPMFS